MNSRWKFFSPSPHSGYHWDGGQRRFFEGWYVRVTLPHCRQSFAFMYSIDDPIGNKPCSGGCVQILGKNEEYLCRTFPDVKTFWAWQQDWGLGHYKLRSQPEHGKVLQGLAPDPFDQLVKEGYQMTPTWHQGKLDDPTGKQVAWAYAVEPVYHWGNSRAMQQATAGWLSFLPIFEPGWQVLVAHGWATGWIDWQGQRYEFEQAPLYAEKNWGGAFPQKWFWIQCNAFTAMPDLTLTAVGGRRKVLGWTESVGMIGLHSQGQFYEFVPWNSTIGWHVTPWGYWHIWAENDRYVVDVIGTVAHAPAQVRVPTEQGLVFACRDTTHGDLHVKLKEKNTHKLVLEADSQWAGLETGGEWDGIWIAN
ncbi:MAG: tocopherol cyclase family protein [Leptolyngbyaceae cyanobacterium bins.302]|nr:tocopherol cyclase family protein [Leptolyngbyaceae cyanobacterium bins.302]